MPRELLRFEHATTLFAGERILDDFKLNLFRGEILHLVGVRNYETDCLLQLFSGKGVLEYGSFYLDDQPVDLIGQPLSQNIGVLCISKESKLIPQLSVAENLFVIKRHSKKFWLNARLIRQQAQSLLDAEHIPVRADDIASQLSPAHQHCVEILRATIQDTKIIILEDIAELYTEQEKELILSLLRKAASQGTAILHISFYLGTFFNPAERTVLIWKGQHIRTFYPNDISAKQLTELIDKLNHGVPSTPIEHAAGGVLLHIRNLHYADSAEPLHIELYEREILGVLDSGLGLTNVVIDHLFESCDWHAGDITLAGHILKPRDAAALAKDGILLIPSILEHSAYLQNLSPKENLLLPIMHSTSLFGLIKNQRMQKYVWRSFTKILDQYFGDTVIQGKYLELSILYYRCILSRPRVMVCANPFLYADAMMRSIVATFIRVAAAEGISTIIFSNDPVELFRMCDRVVELKKQHICS